MDGAELLPGNAKASRGVTEFVKITAGFLACLVVIIVARFTVWHPGLWLPTHVAAGWQSVNCGQARTKSEADKVLDCIIAAQREHRAFIGVFTVKAVEGPLNFAFAGTSSGAMTELAHWEYGNTGLYWARCRSTRVVLSGPYDTHDTSEVATPNCGASDDSEWHRIPW